MSAETYLAIRCDHHDQDSERCGTEWTHPVRINTHRELRRELKTRGWRRTGDGRDLCPDHASAALTS